MKYVVGDRSTIVHVEIKNSLLCKKIYTQSFAKLPSYDWLKQPAYGLKLCKKCIQNPTYKILFGEEE